MLRILHKMRVPAKRTLSCVMSLLMLLSAVVVAMPLLAASFVASSVTADAATYTDDNAGLKRAADNNDTVRAAQILAAIKSVGTKGSVTLPNSSDGNALTTQNPPPYSARTLGSSIAKMFSDAGATAILDDPPGVKVMNPASAGSHGKGNGTPLAPFATVSCTWQDGNTNNWSPTLANASFTQPAEVPSTASGLTQSVSRTLETALKEYDTIAEIPNGDIPLKGTLETSYSAVTDSARSTIDESADDGNKALHYKFYWNYLTAISFTPETTKNLGATKTALQNFVNNPTYSENVSVLYLAKNYTAEQLGYMSGTGGGIGWDDKRAEAKNAMVASGLTAAEADTAFDKYIKYKDSWVKKVNDAAKIRKVVDAELGRLVGYMQADATGDAGIFTNASNGYKNFTMQEAQPIAQDMLDNSGNYNALKAYFGSAGTDLKVAIERIYVDALAVRANVQGAKGTLETVTPTGIFDYMGSISPGNADYANLPGSGGWINENLDRINAWIYNCKLVIDLMTWLAVEDDIFEFINDYREIEFHKGANGDDEGNSPWNSDKFNEDILEIMKAQGIDHTDLLALTETELQHIIPEVYWWDGDGEIEYPTIKIVELFYYAEMYSGAVNNPALQEIVADSGVDVTALNAIAEELRLEYSYRVGVFDETFGLTVNSKKGWEPNWYVWRNYFNNTIKSTTELASMSANDISKLLETLKSEYAKYETESDAVKALIGNKVSAGSTISWWEEIYEMQDVEENNTPKRDRSDFYTEKNWGKHVVVPAIDDAGFALAGKLNDGLQRAMAQIDEYVQNGTFVFNSSGLIDVTLYSYVAASKIVSYFPKDIAEKFENLQEFIKYLNNTNVHKLANGFSDELNANMYGDSIYNEEGGKYKNLIDPMTGSKVSGRTAIGDYLYIMFILQEKIIDEFNNNPDKYWSWTKLYTGAENDFNGQGVYTTRYGGTVYNVPNYTADDIQDVARGVGEDYIVKGEQLQSLIASIDGIAAGDLSALLNGLGIDLSSLGIDTSSGQELSANDIVKGAMESFLYSNDIINAIVNLLYGMILSEFENIFKGLSIDLPTDLTSSTVLHIYSLYDILSNDEGRSGRGTSGGDGRVTRNNRYKLALRSSENKYNVNNQVYMNAGDLYSDTNTNTLSDLKLYPTLLGGAIDGDKFPEAKKALTNPVETGKNGYTVDEIRVEKKISTGSGANPGYTYNKDTWRNASIFTPTLNPDGTIEFEEISEGVYADGLEGRPYKPVGKLTIDWGLGADATSFIGGSRANHFKEALGNALMGIYPLAQALLLGKDYKGLCPKIGCLDSGNQGSWAQYHAGEGQDVPMRVTSIYLAIEASGNDGFGKIIVPILESLAGLVTGTGSVNEAIAEAVSEQKKSGTNSSFNYKKPENLPAWYCIRDQYGEISSGDEYARGGNITGDGENHTGSFPLNITNRTHWSYNIYHYAALNNMNFASSDITVNGTTVKTGELLPEYVYTYDAADTRKAAVSFVNALFKPIDRLVDAITAQPINEILRILPNLSYALTHDRLVKIFDGTLVTNITPSINGMIEVGAPTGKACSTPSINNTVMGLIGNGALMGGVRVGDYLAPESTGSTRPDAFPFYGGHYVQAGEKVIDRYDDNDSNNADNNFAEGSKYINITKQDVIKGFGGGGELDSLGANPTDAQLNNLLTKYAKNPDGTYKTSSILVRKHVNVYVMGIENPADTNAIVMASIVGDDMLPNVAVSISADPNDESALVNLGTILPSGLFTARSIEDALVAMEEMVPAIGSVSGMIPSGTLDAFLGMYGPVVDANNASEYGWPSGTPWTVRPNDAMNKEYVNTETSNLLYSLLLSMLNPTTLEGLGLSFLGNFDTEAAIAAIMELHDPYGEVVNGKRVNGYEMRTIDYGKNTVYPLFDFRNEEPHFTSAEASELFDKIVAVLTGGKFLDVETIINDLLGSSVFTPETFELIAGLLTSFIGPESEIAGILDMVMTIVPELQFLKNYSGVYKPATLYVPDAYYEAIAWELDANGRPTTTQKTITLRLTDNLPAGAVFKENENPDPDETRWDDTLVITNDSKAAIIDAYENEVYNDDAVKSEAWNFGLKDAQGNLILDPEQYPNDFWDGLDEITDSETFFDAIFKLLTPLVSILRTLLVGEDFQILTSDGGNNAVVTIPGYNGYEYGFIPLMEGLGATNGLVAPDTLSNITDDEEFIRTLLEPILNLLDAVIDNPITFILEKAPQILFFLYSGGLESAVLNVVKPLLVVLDTVRPILSENEFFDINSIPEYFKLLDLEGILNNFNSVIQNALGGLGVDLNDILDEGTTLAQFLKTLVVGNPVAVDSVYEGYTTQVLRYGEINYADDPTAEPFILQDPDNEGEAVAGKYIQLNNDNAAETFFTILSRVLVLLSGANEDLIGSFVSDSEIVSIILKALQYCGDEENHYYLFDVVYQLLCGVHIVGSDFDVYQGYFSNYSGYTGDAANAGNYLSNPEPFGNSASLYDANWTKAMASYFVSSGENGNDPQQLEYIINAVLELVFPDAFSINDLITGFLTDGKLTGLDVVDWDGLDSPIFSSDFFYKLVDLIAGLTETLEETLGQELIDTINSYLILDLNNLVNTNATELKPYADAIDNASTWDAAAKEFGKALAFALEPLTPLVELLLCNGKLDEISPYKDKPQYKNVETLITVAGYRGYIYGLAPILAAIGIDVPSYDMLAEKVGGEESPIVAIVNAFVDTLKNKIAPAPIAFLLENLPNIIAFIDSGAAFNSIMQLVSPVYSIANLAIGLVEELGFEDEEIMGIRLADLRGFVNDLLEMVNVKSIIDGFLNTGIDLGSTPLELPSLQELIDKLVFGKITTQLNANGDPLPVPDGNYPAVRLKADQEDTFTAIVTFLLGYANDNLDAIANLMGGSLNQTVIDLIGNVSSNPTALLSVLWSFFFGNNPNENPTPPNFDDGKAFELDSNSNGIYRDEWWTPSHARYVWNNADHFVNNIWEILFGKPLGSLTEFAEDGMQEAEGFLNDLLGQAVFTDEMLDMLVNMILGYLSDDILDILNSQPLNDGRTLNEIIKEAIKIDKNGVATDLDVLGIIKAMKAAADNFVPVNNSRDNFLKNLVSFFAPAMPIIDILLAGSNIKVVERTSTDPKTHTEYLVTVWGANGYKYGLVPLLEAIGIGIDKDAYLAEIEDPATFTQLNDEDKLWAILNPLVWVMDKVLSDPVNNLLRIVPNILYTILGTNLNSFVNKILEPVNNLLLWVKPVLQINKLLTLDSEIIEIDSNNVVSINLDISKILDEMLEGTGLNIDSSSLWQFVIGQVTSYGSKGGYPGLYLSIESTIDGEDFLPDMLTLIMRFVIENFLVTEDNKKVVMSYLEETLSPNAYKLVSKTVEDIFYFINGKHTSQITEKTYYGIDIFMNAVFILFYGADIIECELYKNYKEIGERVKAFYDRYADPNAGHYNNVFADNAKAFTDKYFSNLVDLDPDDDGNAFAPNGLIKFFLDLIAWIRKIFSFNWFG